MLLFRAGEDPWAIAVSEVREVMLHAPSAMRSPAGEQVRRLTVASIFAAVYQNRALKRSEPDLADLSAAASMKAISVTNGALQREG